MTVYKYLLKALSLTVVFALLAASVYAAEPPYTDLWTESAPSENTTNNGTLPGGGSGGGLWSDQLWQDTPVENPKPIDTPKPIDLPKPIQTQSGSSYILVMQVSNNIALVRGAEKALSVPPTNINGRLMLPVKFTAEALNAAFTWSDIERKASIKLGDKNIELWAGRPTAAVNGAVVQLDTPPVVLDGSVLVPVRFVHEIFGYPVEYSTETQVVKLKASDKAEELPEAEVKKPVIDSSFNYFGVWSLHMDGFSGGLPLGTLSVNQDGTYEIKHGISGTAVGRWRQGSADEVIGNKDVLILENGPAGMDWVMIPKKDGMVSVRYHYGYSVDTKIWIEDSLGIQVKK